jgi:uncharacterized protein YqeY
MPLQDQLSADLKDAMRERDDRRRDVLRYTLSQLHNAEIAHGGELDDQAAQAALLAEAKRRRESIEEFRKGGRQDLVKKEEAELAILAPYLPEQLSPDDILAAARKVIADTGATSPKDIGKVMPALMAEVRGRADGAQVSQIVRELLSGS